MEYNKEAIEKINAAKNAAETKKPSRYEKRHTTALPKIVHNIQDEQLINLYETGKLGPREMSMLSKAQRLVLDRRAKKPEKKSATITRAHEPKALN